MLLSLRFCIPAAGAICLATVGHSMATVDFTPRYADILADGVSIHSLYLQDGPQKVFLREPKGWDVKGDGGSLCLTSSAHPSARVDIRNSSVRLPVAPDEKWVKDMGPALLKSLPAGSEKPELVEAKPSPITLNSWKSYEFRLSFGMAGVKYLRTVCFITLHSKDSIEMVTGGTEVEVAAARQAGLALLCTWQEPPVKVMTKMLQ